MREFSEEITGLLEQWQAGDDASLNQVVGEIYGDLRKMAVYHLSKESQAHTLQPTALVNEVYLKLAQKLGLKFPSRKCFFIFVGMLMRRILVDHARGKTASKRGGQRQKVFLELEQNLAVHWGDTDQILALHEALSQFRLIDPHRHSMVEMWFFVGLDANEIGAIFNKSPISVRRDLRLSKAWLARALKEKQLG